MTSRLLTLVPGSVLLFAARSPTHAAEEQCAQPSAGAASRDACGFATVAADVYAQNPLGWEQWSEPLLVTGASEVEGWSSPFRLLERLTEGELDNTTVSVGSGAGTAFFNGAGSSAMSLGEFKKRMGPDDFVFDTQNSAAGRHAELPIPGVGSADPWWNIVSVGTQDAGLALHEHGAAWLALAAGGNMGKQWAVWPPHGSSAQALQGRPATEQVVSWFRGLSDTRASDGMLACLQPPGSVVLLPQGWAHATRNVPLRRSEGSIKGQTTDTVTWAVGRQRQWAPEAQLKSVEPMMNAAEPAQSPPLGLLKAGLALKSLSQRQTTTAAAIAYAEPAVGMLSTAARLTPSRPPPGMAESAIRWLAALFGVTPDLPVAPDLPMVRLKALFGLLDNSRSASVQGREARLVPWAGPQAEMATLHAALAAEQQLQAEADLDSSAVDVSSLMVAEGLEWLGSWWQSRAISLSAAVFSEETSSQAAAVTEAQTAALRLRAAAWDVAQHAEGGATKGLLLQRLGQASGQDDG